MESLDRLLDRSSRASERVRTLERLLFKFEAKSEQAQLCYEVLKIAEEEEWQARWAVRNHPDHSYDGL